jgi:hypothetical protein
MKYVDLREWFLTWLESIPDEPVPLDFETGITEDCRITIRASIAGLDKLREKHEKITKSMNCYIVAKAYYNRLMQVKTAIENEQHDISHFKENGFTEKNTNNKSDAER